MYAVLSTDGYVFGKLSRSLEAIPFTIRKLLFDKYLNCISNNKKYDWIKPSHIECASAPQY